MSQIWYAKTIHVVSTQKSDYFPYQLYVLITKHSISGDIKPKAAK